MDWLAIKYKSSSYLFVQSRYHRELYLKNKMRGGGEVRAIVIKKFLTEMEARSYCDKINRINELLNFIFL